MSNERLKRQHLLQFIRQTLIFVASGNAILSMEKCDGTNLPKDLFLIDNYEMDTYDGTHDTTPLFLDEGNNLRADESKWVDETLRRLSRAVEQSPASIVITDVSGRYGPGEWKIVRAKPARSSIERLL